MNICWRLGSATGKEIWHESLAEQHREYQTVKTLLDRIAAKGYLTVDKVGPVSVFAPACERSQALTRAIRHFVDEVLDRSVAPLYLHFAEHEDLTEGEVRKLRRLLDRRSTPRTK